MCQIFFEVHVYSWIGNSTNQILYCPYYKQISLHSVYENKNSLQATIIPDIYLCNKKWSICDFWFSHPQKIKFFFLQPIWINKYLVVQILHNLTPLACTHRGSRNQVVKRLCLHGDNHNQTSSEYIGLPQAHLTIL